MKREALVLTMLFAVGVSGIAVGQSAPEPAAASTATTVPRLDIVWDCGKCKHNDKVIPLIEQAYAAAAAKNARTLSETETAEVAIIDMRQRPPGVRVAFGFMAGKDRLGVRIRYRGNEYAVSASSANAIAGQNHLSKSVGQRTYAKLTAPYASAKPRK